jgi:hypothetical protein
MSPIPNRRAPGLALFDGSALARWHWTICGSGSGRGNIMTMAGYTLSSAAGRCKDETLPECKPIFSCTNVTILYSAGSLYRTPQGHIHFKRVALTLLFFLPSISCPLSHPLGNQR